VRCGPAELGDRERHARVRRVGEAAGEARRQHLPLQLHQHTAVRGRQREAQDPGSRPLRLQVFSTKCDLLLLALMRALKRSRAPS
jgi:hypothetical protein